MKYSLIIAIIIAFLLCGCAMVAQTRTVDAVVIEASADTMTFEDASGEVWTCDGAGLEVGDVVVLTFHCNGTDTIYDDELIGII